MYRRILKMSEVILEVKNINDKDKLYDELLYEVRTKLLDDELKYLIRKPSVRKEMLEKCGKEAFLLPEKLKFPIYDPRTCKLHCGLLAAAYFRANQWKEKHPEYKKIAEKALKLYNNLKCERKIHVKLENGKVVPLNEFVLMLP